MSDLTDRDDAAHLAEDLATVRRAAAATDPRDYAAGLHAERDVRIGRADYAIANDLVTLASHIAALEALAVTR